MQKWDLSCGAAALATLLTYDLNHPVDERTVAEGMLRRTKAEKVRAQGGFSLLDLQRFSATRGYQADGYGNLGLEDLAALLPAIVPIRIHGYDHFVVVRSAREGYVHFADPAYGGRRMDTATFEQAWVQRVAFVLTSGAP